MSSVYPILQEKLSNICSANGLLNEQVHIQARVLSTEEAIGNPDGDDFPLQKGKERLMEASFGQGRGQAFTDRFGDFTGPLDRVVNLDLNNNYRQAIFVASLNAVLHYLGLTSGAIHCRDQGPTECAERLASFIREQYGQPKIAQIGYQPKMIERLQKDFAFRTVDLDPDNIGQRKANVLVEGPESSQAVCDWADLLVVTGTTLVNDTIEEFLNEKPIIFYGTTVAGAASLMGWPRFCPCSQ